jgi:pimeloyl-ACP methyl ester carboxylesterase
LRTRIKIALLLGLLLFFSSACSNANPLGLTPTSIPIATSAPAPTILPTPPPQLINVDGHNLSNQCMGSGSPAVILESGLGVYSGTWYKVFPEIAKFTKVCRYDRFGLGMSDTLVGPRTSDHMVAELHELLLKALISPPYILVGQSLGGLNIYLFASTFPNEVAGMVFVDTIHPDLDVRIEKLLSPAQAQQRREELEMNPEGITFKDILASEEQVRSAGPIPDVPIIVIRHGLPFEGGPDWPTAQVEALWTELQNDLATLSSDGKVVVAENSHHRIQEDRPDVVIAAIREIFDKVRK